MNDLLLRGVLEAPDDDMPRLVYADWLDENGNQDLAEMIRSQVEITCLKPVTDRRRKVWKTAKARMEAMRFACEPLVGPLMEMGADNIKFRRGFVESLSLMWSDFVRNGAELFSLQPITDVRIVDGIGEQSLFKDLPTFDGVRSPSQLCVAWGRHEAGLPDLSPVEDT